MKKITIVLSAILMFIPICVKAETLQDKYNQLAALQAQYNENKNKKNLTQTQINKLNGEISTISAQIKTTRAEIVQAEKDIENSKKEIEEKKVETDGLIQFLQVSNGDNIYLEYLMDAENYTDFIYRYEVVKQLTNYNSDLIDELETMIIELNKKEKELASKQVKLEKDRKELTEKVNTLSYNLASIQHEGLSIEDNIKVLKEEIAAYESKGCSRNQDLSSCNAMINARGWVYPLAKGCVTSEYTGFNQRYDYSGGWGHHAIDLGCNNEGTPVTPAAGGQIAAIVEHYKCGGNMVYVYHKVNGKAYTTVYMHLLKFGSNLYVGKTVTEKTVIGYVGGYSTSTAHGGYDGCTTGAHLHFGMADGHHATGFESYSFNPRNLYAFPKSIFDGGGYFYR